MSNQFASVTEIAGDEVSREQVDRLCARYFWAGRYCRDKDVLEVACGTGQGLGYLATVARSVIGGDISPELVRRARAHYGDRIRVGVIDAQSLPFGNASFDVVLIFEALYYLPNVEHFVAEARRVLRPGGRLLVATANKDLYDFNPSPYSHRYLGVVELGQVLGSNGFDCEFYGNTPVTRVSLRQRILRPVKGLAVALGLIPKSMKGKKLLKRLVFGELVRMSMEITAQTGNPAEPSPIAAGAADRGHKVIFCAAILREQGGA